MLKTPWLRALSSQLFPRKIGRRSARRSVPISVQVARLEPRVLLSASPLVTSMDRVEAPDTNATSVDYTVTFSEDVQGVDAADFKVLTSGGVVADATVTVTPVNGSVYTVTASGINGDGIVGVDLNDNNSIHDAEGHTLIGAGITSQLSNLSGGQYIDSWQVSSDGSTIVYAVGEGNFVTSLWGASTAEGPAVQISIPLSPSESINEWRLSPDGQHVIFDVRDNSLGYVTSVWISPTAGGPATELLGSLTSNQIINNWQFNSTGTSVLFTIYDGDVGYTTSIWSASTAGGSAIQLNTPLGANESINTWEYSDDGSRLLFTVYDYSIYRTTAIWAAPSSGAAGTQLHQLTDPNQNINNWQFAGGSNIVFTVYDYGSGVQSELWLAPAGGTATQLNGPLGPSQSINWNLSPDQSTLEYTIYDNSTGQTLSLWMVPTSGGAPTELQAAPPGGTIDWQFSYDGTHLLWAVYDSSVNQFTGLWGVPLTGGPATMLNPPLTPTQTITHWDFSQPQATFIITDSLAGSSIWVTPTTGSPAVQLSIPITFVEGVSYWRFSDDGSQILVGIHNNSDAGRTTSVWVSPITGGPAALIAAPIASDESINNAVFSPNGTYVVVTVTSSTTGMSTSLWSAPVTGGSATQLTLPFGPTESLYDWHFSPNGNTVFYVAYDSSLGQPSSLWSVPITGATSALQLSPPLEPTEVLNLDWAFSSNGAWMIFSVYDWSLGYTTSIWAGPADGGPAVDLTPPLGPSEVIWNTNSSPDQNTLVTTVHDLSTDTDTSLWLASAVTGTFTKLTPELSPTQSISRYEFDSEGANVAFAISDSTVGQITSLWLAPTTGAPAVQINPPLGSGESIGNWSFSPDGNNLAFSIEAPMGWGGQLWVLPLSSGASATLVKSASLGETINWSWNGGDEIDFQQQENGNEQDSILIYRILDTRNYNTVEIGEYSAINGSVTGPTYTIDQTVPTVAIGPSSSSPITGTTATYTATFSEDVVGVTADDFGLALSGVAVSGPIVVTPVNGHVYTISLSGISGNGTVGVNLVNADHSVQDAATNVVAATTGSVLTVNQPGGPLQLSGTTLTINGTSQSDVITITEANSLNVVFDGITFVYTPAQVTTIIVNGNDGNDTINVNSLLAGTALTANGGNGNDTIKVAASVMNAITMLGGDGNDLLVGGSGNDTLFGGTGDDWLNGGDGSDLLTGGVGNDVYAFDDATANQIDTVVELAGEGTDLLNFAKLTTNVTADLTSITALATMSHRIVVGGSSVQGANFENITGGSGNDTLIGNESNNVLTGNGGNDTLRGLGGSDQLDGGDGNDTLLGGAGGDYLIGGIGNDWLNGGDGSNILAGGQGSDVYAFDNATTNQVDTVIEQTGEGTDTLNFASMSDNVTANLTSDTALATMNHRIVQTGGAGQAANFENAYGGAGTDTLIGNAANNVLMGNGGADALSGGSGNDELYGGDGRNILIGGTGADYLMGGSDQDVLLSDSYNNETNPLALQSLLVEWVQTTPYLTRIDHIMGTTSGGLNGSYVLNSTTVAKDSNADYLTGGGGQDWFLANSLQDVITDKAVDEVFTHIDTWGV